MIKSDKTLKMILAAILLGMMMAAVSTVYATFFNAEEANAKTYRVSHWGLCNAYLDSSTEPWCVEIRENSKDEHLMAVSP